MFVTTVSYGRVRGKARQYPYYQACLYEYRPRKRDNVLIAKLISTIGEAYRSTHKAEVIARQYALENDYDFDYYVRQNSYAPPNLQKKFADFLHSLKYFVRDGYKESQVIFDEFVKRY